MNIVSRKLHELEKNVLPELPDRGTTKITWENGDIELDRAEAELHRRASQILEAHADEMKEALEKLAKEQFVPVSSLIKQAIAKYLEAQGLDWRKEPEKKLKK